MAGFIFGVILVIIAFILFAPLHHYFIKQAGVHNEIQAGQNHLSNYDQVSTYEGAYKAGALWSRITAGFAVVGGALLIIFSMVYTQDVGDANVLKDVTGNVVGQETSSGAHLKAPWVDTVLFSIRQQPVLVGDKNDVTGVNTPGAVFSKAVTTNDKNGVKVVLSVAVRYSIDPASVDSIYRQFKSEENFKTVFIEQDVRSAVRDAPNDFATLDVLTDRIKLQKAMQDGIEEHWKGSGVTIDSISIQAVDYPKDVTDTYAAAVKSQIKVTQATNNLAAAKVDAQQLVVKAQAQADANNLLSASLSPQVLQSKYLDALKTGTVYVVPAGSTPFIGTAK